MLTLQNYVGNVQRNLCRSSLSSALLQMANLQGQASACQSERSSDSSLPVPSRHGSSTIGDRQTANFCSDGFSTFTWQVYLPGCNFPSGTLKPTGTAFDFAFSPVVIFNGAVSKAFTLPR